MPERERPVPPALPTASQVPAELLPLKRWCCWVATWDEGKQKWRKPPHSPVTGERVGPVPKNKHHFLTFEEALAGAKQHNLDGVGFVFFEEDGYIGIDFDDADSKATDWFQWLPTYVEMSPSGSGYHFIGKGKIAKALNATKLPGSEKCTVEAYGWERYFTFTGQSIGELVQVADIQGGLDKLLAHVGQKPEARVDATDDPTRPLTRLTIRRLHKENLDKLRHAKQGEGNATLNSVAFFAARAFTAGVLDGTESKIKRELLDIVTKEWAVPHPEAGARETIISGWNSGVGIPLPVAEDEWPQVTETIEQFNQQFYVIENYGGKVRVAWEELSRISKGKSFILVTQSFVDFKNRYMNQLIQVGENEDGSPKLNDRAQVWLRNRNRAQFEKVIFEPEVKTPANIRNLWRGFAYQPKKGDCGLYLKHVFDNVCQQDPKKYEYLIGWMAYAVRHPNEHGHVAIVVQGEKGVGKNVFAEGFCDLWGQHGIVIADQARLTKNFNSHLRDKCVVVADEAFFAGDRRHEGVLKALITGTTLTIEAKGVDAVTTPNLLHIIIIGNDQWLVPASSDERRYLVVKCGSEQKQKTAYFMAIRKQLVEGGYEALLYHLLHEVDLRSFNVREAPHTEELRLQMTNSLRGIESAFNECLYTAMIPGQCLKDGTARVRTGDFADWARRREGRGWSNIKPHQVELLFSNMRFIRDGGLIKNDKMKWWVIPPLKEARKRWDEVVYVMPWPEDQSDWDQIQEEL